MLIKHDSCVSYQINLEGFDNRLMWTQRQIRHSKERSINAIFTLQVRTKSIDKSLYVLPTRKHTCNK
jgi:hypothetical protein